MDEVDEGKTGWHLVAARSVRCILVWLALIMLAATSTAVIRGKVGSVQRIHIYCMLRITKEHRFAYFSCLSR